jgi:hypothetical protein
MHRKTKASRSIGKTFENHNKNIRKTKEQTHRTSKGKAWENAEEKQSKSIEKHSTRIGNA